MVSPTYTHTWSTAALGSVLADCYTQVPQNTIILTVDTCFIAVFSAALHCCVVAVLLYPYLVEVYVIFGPSACFGTAKRNLRRAKF